MKRLLPLMVATLLSTNISRADSNIPLLPQDKQEAVISDNISENHDNDYWIGFNTITYDNPNQ